MTYMYMYMYMLYRVAHYFSGVTHGFCSCTCVYTCSISPWLSAQRFWQFGNPESFYAHRIWPGTGTGVW